MLEDRFSREGKIGQGSSGREVHKAKDHRSGEYVALKTFRDIPKRELHLAHQVHHENVVQTYHWEDEGKCLVMEYIDGGTLRDLLQRGPLELATSLQIALQILAGLKAIHAKNIVHKDLKPQNIFLTRAGVAKIGDFGQAQLIGTKWDPGIEPGIGTPGYRPPEQGTERDSSQIAIDIFSFGVLLAELISGIRPLLGQPVRLPSGTPEHIQPIISRCMDPDPACRFASVDELQLALTSPPIEPPDEQPDEQPIRAPRFDALIVVLVMGLLAIALWLERNQIQVIASSVFAPAVRPAALQQEPPKLTVTEDNRPTVAVLFEQPFQESLTLGLLKTGRYQLVERQKLDAVLSELQLADRGVMDKATAVAVGHLVGAQYMLFGSLQPFGDEIQINAYFVKTETAVLLTGESINGKPSQLPQLAVELAQRLHL